MASDDGYADQPTVSRITRTALPVGRPFVLSVVEGSDEGQQYPIDASLPTRTLVGKSQVCQIQLTDPSVSRRHFAVEVVDHRLRLRDLGSTNGTSVNGIAVVEAYLTGGEQIHIGGTVLRIDIGAPQHLQQEPSATRFGTTVGGSRAMRRLYPLCERLAQANVPVVIEGETGVGKEQLAESLHQQGTRGQGPFVVFDCTAVAPSLIESELFGHEQGAFTGSATTHRGVFEQAHGGTLFIDEIGDMPLELQPKLLRAIERLEVKRVGGSQSFRVDVRVIAATRRDLDREVQLGRFRDDLFHRLAVARLELPPLRERKGDVALLAQQFWGEFGGAPGALPEPLLRSWEDYGWPGNVRELRNAVARRLALGDLTELDPTAADRAGSSGGGTHAVAGGGDAINAVLALDLPLPDTRQRVMGELERRYVQRMLDAHDGNVTRAAAASGITRRQFQRLKSRLISDEES